MDKALIAKKIKQYRHIERMSQETLADKIGVSDTYIRKLESGERTPSLETTLALAAALNTSPNQLLLPASGFDRSAANNIMRLLNDCSSSEFTILYENMIELKSLLRKHRK